MRSRSAQGTCWHRGPLLVLIIKGLRPLESEGELTYFELEVKVAPRPNTVKKEPQELDEGTFDELIGDAAPQSQILIPGKHFSWQKMGKLTATETALAAADTIPALHNELLTDGSIPEDCVGGRVVLAQAKRCLSHSHSQCCRR